METGALSLNEAVTAFLNEEAHLLDQNEFKEWLSLFHEDGYYWMPVSPHETERLISPALFDADKAFLEIIINRLYLDTAYSFVPAPRSCRFVSNVTILGREAGQIRVRSKLHFEEYRTLEVAEDDHRSLSGTVLHVLETDGDSFKIVSKRVDLIQSEAALSAVSAPL